MAADPERYGNYKEVDKGEYKLLVGRCGTYLLLFLCVLGVYDGFTSHCQRFQGKMRHCESLTGTVSVIDNFVDECNPSVPFVQLKP